MKKFRIISIASICVILAATCVATASMQRIEVVLGFGLVSDYDATAPGTQALQSTNGAYVFFSEPSTPSIYFNHTNIWGNFTNVTDNSSGGLASASFASGTWQIQLYNPNNYSELVFNIAGTVDWYREDESAEAENTVNGVGKVTINYSSLYVNPLFWGAATWGAQDGKSAVTTTITSAQQGSYGLVDYQTDWSSDNVTMVVYADSSYAVPEPATISLIAMGGLLFIRRKR